MSGRADALRDLLQAPITAPPIPRARLAFPGTCEPEVSNLPLRVRGHAICMGDCSEAEITTEPGNAFFLCGATAAMPVHAGLNLCVRHARWTTLAARQDITEAKAVQQGTLTAGETAATQLIHAAVLGDAVETATLVTVIGPGGSTITATIHPTVTLRIGSMQLRLRESRSDGWQRLFLHKGELHAEAFPALPGVMSRRLR